MNEFTKDELEYIYFCVDIVTYKNDEFDENEFTINKIQFLIDNYCEHESGWIDINDRLPDKDHVIAYCQSYPANFVSMVRFEQRHSGEFYFWSDSLDKKVNITHWMPLPTSPQ